MFIAQKNKQILFREVDFWTRIWSGRDDTLRARTEACDDGNSAKGDGSKGKCRDRLLTYIFLRSEYLLSHLPYSKYPGCYLQNKKYDFYFLLNQTIFIFSKI